MKTRFFTSLVLLIMVLTMSAVPAKPGQKKLLRLSDGTTVEARLVGDEHGHFWCSADGRAFRKVQNEAFYEQIDVLNVKKNAQKRRAKANLRRAKRQMPKKAGLTSNFIGKKKGLIILVDYTDVKFQAENNQALYNRIANEANFMHDEFVGSVYDYFLAQSEGLFELNFDVVGPYTLSHNREYYGGNDEDNEDMHPAGMVVEACRMADADVDFADYDWDGDGEVDQVYVLYAGPGEANGGDEETVYPHEWTLSSAQYYGEDVASIKLDGVWVDTYACSNELQPAAIDRYYNVTAWKIDGIGTICHEFSHCLGYPDFYDTNYQNSGMGDWDLMDDGSYNGDGFCPAGYTSYERWVAGWKEPIELTEDTEVASMKPLQDGGDAYVIYNDGNRNEYFLLENRQFIDWDAEIPGKGLLIIHVDYNETAWNENKVNNTKGHERMTWIAADNQKLYETKNGMNYYIPSDMASDTYPYKTNKSFTNTSKPAATLYNKNTDGSKKLNKSVLDITQNSDKTISFKFEASAGSVTPTGGDFKRISDVSDLTEDAEYLIVYEISDSEAVAYAGYEEAKSCGTKVDLGILDNTTSGDGAAIIKLKKASNGNWYIMDGDNYLYFRGTKNVINASTTISGTGFTWSITTSSITNVDANNRKLQYNPSAEMFRCYTGSQKDVVLYIKKETTAIEKPTVSSEVSPRGIFDLQGRKMSENAPLQRGIYIVNGRKVVIQ